MCCIKLWKPEKLYVIHCNWHEFKMVAANLFNLKSWDTF